MSPWICSPRYIDLIQRICSLFVFIPLQSRRRGPSLIVKVVPSYWHSFPFKARLGKSWRPTGEPVGVLIAKCKRFGAASGCDLQAVLCPAVCVCKGRATSLASFRNKFLKKF